MKKTLLDAAVLAAGMLAAALGMGAAAGTALESPWAQPVAPAQGYELPAETLEAVASLPENIEGIRIRSTEVDLEAFGGAPAPHQVVGRVTVDNTAIDADLIYGDSYADLRKGACFYAGRNSHIPGGGSTMLVGAHNNSHFHTLGDAQIGDLVHVSMYYGDYTYRVVETAVVGESDSSAYDLASEEEILILYTCYPFDQLTHTPYRYFAYCELVAGSPLAQ